MAWADTAAEALQAGGWLIPLAWAKLRQADLAPAGRTAGLLAGVAGLVGELKIPELRYGYQLRLARLHRREEQDARAEALLRGAIGTAEELGASLPDPVLRAAFRAGRLDAHDELLDLLVTRGGPGDLAEACRIGDRAKAQTLIDLITATIGPRRLGADASGSSPLLEQRCADLSAVYGSIAAADRPGQQAVLRRRAEELEQEISALRLERTLAAASGDAARPDAGAGERSARRAHARLPRDG